MPNSNPNSVPNDPTKNPNVMTPDDAVLGERGEKAQEATKTGEDSFDAAYQDMNEAMNDILNQFPEDHAERVNIDIDIARARADADAAARAVSEAVAKADADTNDLEAAVSQVKNAEQEAAGPNRGEVADEGKNHPGFKSVITTAAIGAAFTVLMSIVGYNVVKPSEEKKVESNDNDYYDRGAKDHNPQDANWYNEYYGRNSVEVERAQGIKDGYNEQGMWLDKNKPGKGFAFANADEVAKVCYNNPKEMMKYTGKNQVESLASFIGSMPDRVRPEGFKGLSILQADYKLENISDEAYDKVLAEFNNAIDVSKADAEVVNGTYHNVYMAYRTEDGRRVGANDTYFDEARNVTHDNMELVRCKTNESNTEVTKFTWTYRDEDGNIVEESMIVKIGPGGCIQPISVDGKGMDNIEEIDEHDDNGDGEGDDNGDGEGDDTGDGEGDGDGDGDGDGEGDDTGEKIPRVIIPEKPEDDGNTTPEDDGGTTPEDEDNPNPNPNPNPTVTPRPKDVVRTTQLDEENHEEIAEDIHTGELKGEQILTEEVEAQPKSNTPDTETYREDHKPKPIIVVDEAYSPAPSQSVEAPTNIQPTEISPENNPTENLGGANYQNPAENTPPPVTPNVEAQAQADANEMTQEEARNMSQAEIDDIFASLGL